MNMSALDPADVYGGPFDGERWFHSGCRPGERYPFQLQGQGQANVPVYLLEEDGGRLVWRFTGYTK